MSASLNDLVRYINSGHELDPPQIKQERIQLRDQLAEFAQKIVAGEPIEYPFTGRISVAVVDGKIQTALVADNGNARTGDLGNILMSLNDTSQTDIILCEGCENYFLRTKSNIKYCSEVCKKAVWAETLKKRKK